MVLTSGGCESGSVVGASVVDVWVSLADPRVSHAV